jgi:thioredoxin-disulfide reductase
MFDLIIIGGSAAATAAGVYAARRNVNFKIITKDFGGEVAISGEIANWPGIIKTDGLTLSQQFKDHLKSYDVEPEEGIEVQKISKSGDGTFCISAKADGSECDYTAKAVIITTGVHPRELNLPSEKAFRNKGVSYCTVCDGPLFQGKTVAVIGGGNSALESALMLADIATKVYLVNKNAQFKGEEVLIKKCTDNSNIEIIYNAVTTNVLGDEFVAGLVYKDKEGNEKELKVDGIFVHIGQLPNSSLVSDDVKKDNFGQIIVNKNCETNVAGLYAAGDVTDVPFKQIVIAAGQGTIAALSAISYLNKLK